MQGAGTTQAAVTAPAEAQRLKGPHSSGDAPSCGCRDKQLIGNGSSTGSKVDLGASAHEGHQRFQAEDVFR